MNRRQPGVHQLSTPKCGYIGPMSHWPDAEKELWHEYKVVVPAFREFLEADGWAVNDEVANVDLIATKGNRTVIAEAKGRKAAGPGAGIDAAYGQLLRRMSAERVADLNVRFALVVPRNANIAAARVPKEIREALRIDVYLVSDEGYVEILNEQGGNR